MEKKKRRQPTKDEMLVRMAGLCAVSEQCSADIRAKIIKAGFSSVDADSMLRYLADNRYIDDSRFAKAFATDKVRFAGWGRMKIRMSLRIKGLSDTMIAAALGNIDANDYTEALGKSLAAKARGLDLAEIKDRQRLYRHLASRGFESSVIIPAIRSHMQAEIDKRTESQ